MSKPLVKSPHDCVWRSVYSEKEGQQRKGTRGRKKKVLCPLVFSLLLSRVMLSIIFTSSSAQLEFMHPFFSIIPSFSTGLPLFDFKTLPSGKLLKGIHSACELASDMTL